MKLIFCFYCADVFKLTRVEERVCKCGRSRGRYRPDGHHVDVTEDALVLGLDNNDLRHAGISRLSGGDAEIPINCWLHEHPYHKIHYMLPGEMMELP